MIRSSGLRCHQRSVRKLVEKRLRRKRRRNNLKAFGLNLRLEWLDEILESQPALESLQLIADNWLSDGPHHQKLDKIRQDYKISFHCLGMNIAGCDPVNSNYLDNLKVLIDRFQPEYVSDHLAVQKHQGICFHDLLPFPLHDQSLQRCVDRVDYIQSYLNRNLLVENLSYYISFENSSMYEPEFLEKLVSQSGCWLLFDANNAYVNAVNNIEEISMYRRLPFAAIKEVHVAGAEWVDGVYVDTHGTHVNDDVLNLVQNLNTDGATIFYERDHNLGSLEEVISEVERIKKRFTGSELGPYVCRDPLDVQRHSNLPK